MEEKIKFKGLDFEKLVETFGLMGKGVKVCFTWGDDAKHVQGYVFRVMEGALIIRKPPEGKKKSDGARIWVIPQSSFNGMSFLEGGDDMGA